jgi:hypothetical protein
VGRTEIERRIRVRTLSFQPVEVMIYGPRNAQELQVILGLIEESLNTARLANDA